LEIALITGGETLQRGEEGKEGARDATGLAAQKLPGIRILFLRHEAAAGGKLVGENGVGKFLRSKENEILGEAREMRGDSGECKEVVERKIAIADGIQAVGGDARETKIAGDGLAIDGERTTCKGAGSHGANVGACGGMLQTREVARKSLRVRHQEMGQKNGLSMLEMGHASHRHFEVDFGLIEESTNEKDQTAARFTRGLAEKKAKIRGNEIVPAAARVEFPAQRAERLDQCLFDEVMDVLGIRGIKPRRIGFGAFRNVVQCGMSLANFRIVKDAGAKQSAGPGAVHGKLIRKQAPVKRKRPLKRVELFVRRALEAATPQAIVFAFGHRETKPCFDFNSKKVGPRF